MQLAVRRISLLLFATLISGLFINQIYSEGIRWSLLKPQFANSENDSSILFISADSAFLFQMEGDVTFIDVRTKEEFEVDRIPGAISIPLFSYYKSPEVLEELDPEHRYILYCFDPECLEAKSLAREMVNHQFKNVMVIHSGFSGWLEMGFPVETP